MTDHLPRFCKFCGQAVDTPCLDETDLSIFQETVERCSDAAFAYDAERYFEGLTVSSAQGNKP